MNPGDEPIPGYRLLTLLGRGQFGQVWKAEAPGGVEVALKFIPLRGRSGFKEYRGIKRVLTLKSVHLVPMNAIFLLDKEGNVLDDAALKRLEAEALGNTDDVTETVNLTTPRAAMLVVSMGLGEKSLANRLKEYQAELVADYPADERERRLDELMEKGEAGLPVSELLRYMGDAARGIDFLNQERHVLGDGSVATIQHCDIKPDNIMLIGGAAQVCDFGLARELAVGAADVRLTQGGIAGSPAYMAPECVDCPEPSQATDQYSLAITYVELRTGDIPFDKQTKQSALAIFLAHKQGKLDLTRLTPAEREVIAKATSIDPDDRFDSTWQMLRALRKAIKKETGYDENDSSTQFTEPGKALKESANRLPKSDAATYHYVTKSKPAEPESPHHAKRTLGSDRSEHVRTLEPPSPTDRGKLPQNARDPQKNIAAADADERKPRAQSVRATKRSRGVGTETITEIRKEPPPRRFVGKLVITAGALGILALSVMFAYSFRFAADDEKLAALVSDKIEKKDFEGACKLLPGFSKDTARENARREVRSVWQSHAEIVNKEKGPEDALAECERIKEQLGTEPATVQLCFGFLTSAVDEGIKLFERESWEDERLAKLLSRLTELLNHPLTDSDDPSGKLKLNTRLNIARAVARLRPKDREAVRTELQLIEPQLMDLQTKQQAHYWALKALLDYSGDFDAALSDLASLYGRTNKLFRDLDPWEAKKTENLRNLAFEEATKPSRLAVIPDNVFDTIWPDKLFDLLLKHAAADQNRGDFGACRRFLERALKSARNKDERKRVELLNTVVDLRDPATSAEQTISRFGRLAVDVSATDLDLLCVDLAQRVDRSPDWLDASITELASVRERVHGDDTRKPVNGLYLQLLARRVRRIVVQTGEIDYARLASDCREIRSAGQSDAVVDSCLVESDIATQREQMDRAAWSRERKIAQEAQSKLDADEPLADYVYFVQGLVHNVSDMADKVKAAELVMRALDTATGSASGALSVTGRHEQMTSILTDGALALRDGGDDVVTTPPFAGSDADKALQFLTAAEGLGSAMPDNVTANLALAYYYGSKPNAAKTIELIDQLKSKGEVSPQLLLAAARAYGSLEGLPNQSRAVLNFATLLDRVNKKEFAGDDGIRLYEIAIEPAVEAATPVGAALASMNGSAAVQQVKRALARVYAAKAELIRSNVLVEKKWFQKKEDPYLADKEVYEAYREAARWDPQPDYMVAQGKARIELPGNPEDTFTEVDRLAKLALDKAPQHSGANGLKGYVLILTARREPAPTKSIGYLQEALKYYDRARSNPSDDDVASYLVGASTANVELSFRMSDKQRQRELLDEAARLARQATEKVPRRRPEYAWNALGNALEDMALYLCDVKQYDTALDCFMKGYDAALGTFQTGASSLFNLARTRYRKAMFAYDYDNLSLAKLSDELDLAEKDLNDALKGTTDRVKAAELAIWLAQLNASRARIAASNDDRAKQYANAENWYRTGVEQARSIDDFNWPKYQLMWAQLAYERGDTENSRVRAKELVDFKDEGQFGRIIAPAVLKEAIVLLLHTTPDLAGKVQLVDRQLARFPEDQSANSECRIQLLLFRSGAIKDADSKDWDKNSQMCRNDAETALRLAQSLVDPAHRAKHEAFARTGIGKFHLHNYADRNFRGDRTEAGRAARAEFKTALELLKALPDDSVRTSLSSLANAGKNVADARRNLESCARKSLKEHMVLSVETRTNLGIVNIQLLTSAVDAADQNALKNEALDALKPIGQDDVPPDYFRTIQGQVENLEQAK